MIDQMELEDSACFEGSFREARVRFGRTGVAARVIMHHHEAVRRMDDDRPKDFARMGQALIDGLSHNSGTFLKSS
jgi:hypothetical protein